MSLSARSEGQPAHLTRDEMERELQGMVESETAQLLLEPVEQLFQLALPDPFVESAEYDLVNERPMRLLWSTSLDYRSKVRERYRRLAQFLAAKRLLKSRDADRYSLVSIRPDAAPALAAKALTPRDDERYVRALVKEIPDRLNELGNALDRGDVDPADLDWEADL